MTDISFFRFVLVQTAISWLAVNPLHMPTVSKVHYSHSQVVAALVENRTLVPVG
jgi:hypothetical protein